MFCRVTGDQNHIARIERVTRLLYPFALTVDQDRAGSHSHGLQSLEILNALKDDSAFEEEKHAKLHETKIPVVVQKP